jgi:transcriptional regulator with XRE-family HTH domain
MFSMERFSDWLLNELKSRDMSQSDLARIGGLGSGTISNIMSGNRKVGQDTLKKIASALRLPTDLVFEKAGIFAPKSTDPIIAEITHLASQLPPEDVQDLIDLARSKIQRHERTANAARKS